jgi:hypothetical protein
MSPRKVFYFVLWIATVFGPGCTESSADPDEAGSGGLTSEAGKVGILAPDDESTREIPRRERRADDWFDDVTPSSGVEFRHHSGRDAGKFTMVETFGGGVGLLDYDVDGDLDIFCVGGGSISPSLEFSGARCRLFRNEGNFRFLDVTEPAGLDVAIDYSHGVAVGDVDNDGRPDLFVTCYGRSRLFMNVGRGRFEDATDRSNVDVRGWHTAACLADVTSDGLSDLFVAGYLQWAPDPAEYCRDPQSGLRDVCMPGSFPGAQDRLFVGVGGGKFVDATRRAGLRADGKGLGAVVADFDENGHLDIYVANDVDHNHLYLGRGTGEFTEAAGVAGVAGNEFGVAEGSMGVDAGDYNGDGRLDIVVTNYEFEDNSLYRSEGGGLFTHVTVPTGLAGVFRPFVGWGTLFVDADLDGRPDLLVVDGHVTYRNRQSPFRQPAFLFRNQGGTRFENVTDQAGPWFSVPHSARGVAAGDLDNDGAVDLVVSELDGPISILRNLKTPRNWVGVRARGVQSGTDAVGTRVRVSDSSLAAATIVGGRSYLSASDSRLVFPVLDDDRARADVEVRWPSGEVEVFRDLATKGYRVVTQGTGTADMDGSR